MMVFLPIPALFTAVHCRLSKAFFLAREVEIKTGRNKDCTTVTVAAVLPVGYVVSAGRIADRRMILTGYRLADLLTRVLTL
jgi:hypothetical protein